MQRYKESLKQIEERINQRIPAKAMATERFKRMAGHLTTMERALNSIATARADRVATPEARRDKIKSATAAAFDMVAKARREVNEASKKAEASFISKAREVSRMTNSMHAPEIRARFASLDPGEKSRWIQSFIKDGEGSSMAAIIDAPSILSGLNKTDKEKYLNQFLETHAPDVWATRAQYKDLVSHIMAGIKTIEDAATESESEA